jgi:23S rRNA (cytosine1962-C5)-methyltransferase
MSSLSPVRLILKPGKEKSLKRRHPWVFSGAIARVEGNPGSGDTVRVTSHDGEFLAQAAFSPQSQIRARVWSWVAGVTIDAAFIADTVRRSAARRGSALATRLIHGEADGLPGIVADRYNDTAVVQLLSAGAERWRDHIADALAALPGITRVYERSDADVRVLEGLEPRTGVLRGTAPPPSIVISEGAVQYSIDVAGGHKTGFYLDQSDSRARLGADAVGGDVLNCFCYTGGFSIAALKGGAKSALSIDSSGPAIEIARDNMRLNGLDETRAEWLEADVFKALRELRDQGRSFDMIVLDPPKFAPTPATVERAARAYKDINLLGLKLLRPGGKLYTFSCSGGVSADLFQKIVAGAAVDAEVEANIEARLCAAPDHPVLLNFPEGEYLKGLVLQRS